MTAAFTVCVESLSMMTCGRWTIVSAVSRGENGSYRGEFHRVLRGQRGHHREDPLTNAKVGISCVANDLQ